MGGLVGMASWDDDNALFIVEGNQLKTATVLNSQTNPNCWIRARSTDQGGLYVEET